MIAAAVVGLALLVLLVEVLTWGTLGATTQGADAAVLLAKKGYCAYR
jgi:hypothetical protein